MGGAGGQAWQEIMVLRCLQSPQDAEQPRQELEAHSPSQILHGVRDQPRL